jgi:nucleoside-diphosphate-sugar epimerase
MSQIIGTGMIAKKMNIPFDVIIFASGVSNSQCISNTEFKREIELFKSIEKNKKIIYFSTVTIYQKQRTPYISHKILMEALVKNLCENYLILRLPNLIGSSQSNNQLIPSLVKQITNGEVTIQKNAKRCILDVEESAA